MAKKAIKKVAKKVLSCFLVFMILMSAMPFKDSNQKDLILHDFRG